MKNILSSLNESEKRRILEMHYKATNKQYLNEQAPAADKTGIEKFIKKINGFPQSPENVEVTVNYDDGTITLLGLRKTNYTNYAYQLKGQCVALDPKTKTGTEIEWTQLRNDEQKKPEGNFFNTLDIIFNPYCAPYLKKQGINPLSSEPTTVSNGLDKGTLDEIVMKIRTDKKYVKLNIDRYRKNMCAYLNTKQYTNTNFSDALDWFKEIISDPTVYPDPKPTSDELDNLDVAGKTQRFCKA